MTERWRKKLGDLDETGPGEDVFARAHEGPTQPDDVIPLPRTSTRIVTGIAAFAVFALAISVFAIPVLRMNDQPASIGGSQILPLWPERSLDDLEALQQRADSGEADAVWAVDPDQVALRFGQEVMGWVDVNLIYREPLTVIVCEQLASPGTPTASTICVDPSTGDVLSMSTSSYPGGGPSSVAPSRFATYVIGMDACTGAFGSCRFPAVELSMEQPLDAGEGSIWAVTSVRSEFTGINVDPGASVSDGDELFASVTPIESSDSHPLLGYHVGPGACDADRSTGEYERVGTNVRLQLANVTLETVALTLPVSYRCSESSPGYAWAALSSDPELAQGSSVDPFTTTPSSPLLDLTAVPVTFLPTALDGGSTGSVTTPPTIPTSPTPDGVSWSTFVAGDLGFSIDYPSSASIDASGEAIAIEVQGGPRVTIRRVGDSQGANDSTFPLDPEHLEGKIVDAFFRGDGQLFEWQVEPAGDSAEQLAVAERMLRSISFEPWEQGETRNGWTAVGPIAQGGAAWAFAGANLVIVNEGSDGYWVIDTPDSCGGEQVVSIEDGWPVMECPDGSKVSYNDHGMPAATNPQAFQDPALVYPAIVAHDGSLLAELP